MTDDLDTLRPEVRAAMEAMDADVQTLEWLCIRAELLRLQSTESRANEWQLRAEKAEAELAALKARIDGSSVVKIANYGDPFIVLPDHLTVPNSLKGKAVRLLVEE